MSERSAAVELADDPPEPHRTAARVRAAVAYSGERLEVIGQRSIGTSKLRRIASVTSPRGATLLELWSIADACGVPRTWLELGQWDDSEGRPPVRLERTNPFGPGPTEDRLEIIERYLFALLRLEESRGEPLPPLELGRSPRARASGAPKSRPKRRGGRGGQAGPGIGASKPKRS